LLKYSPVTPSLRHVCLVNKKFLESGLFLKKFFLGSFGNKAGRNSEGRITVRRKLAGHKKLYRNIDLSSISGIPYRFESFEYDPYRSSFISLVFYMNGLYSYVLTPSGVLVGDLRISSVEPLNYLNYGDRSVLYNLPIGSVISNISTSFSSSSKFARSAGAFAVLLRKSEEYAELKLPSGKRILCSLFSFATLGRISNQFHKNEILGKSGRSKWRGHKSEVRGVAMNPVDHPHGGGEGKKSKPGSPSNPWGTVLKNSRKFKRNK